MTDRSTVTAFAELALQFTGFRNVDLFSQGIYQIRARAHGARSGRAAVPFATSKAAADASVAAGSTANRDEVLPAHILDGSGDFCSPAFRVRYCDEEVILRTLGRLRIELSLDRRPPTPPTPAPTPAPTPPTPTPPPRPPAPAGRWRRCSSSSG